MTPTRAILYVAGSAAIVMVVAGATGAAITALFVPKSGPRPIDPLMRRLFDAMDDFFYGPKDQYGKRGRGGHGGR